MNNKDIKISESSTFGLPIPIFKFKKGRNRGLYFEKSVVDFFID